MDLHGIIRRRRQERMQMDLHSAANHIQNTAHTDALNTASYRSALIAEETESLTINGSIPDIADAPIEDIPNFGEVLPGQAGLLLTPEGDFNRGSAIAFPSPFLAGGEETV